MYRSLALTLLFVAVATAQCPSSSCRFTFCEGGDSVVAGAPDTALSEGLCDGTERLTGGAETGEAMVSGTPISRVEVDGQPFTPSFIKTFPSGDGGVAVGHETPQEGQVAAIGDGICITLPFAAWMTNGTNKTSGGDNDCLAFRLLPPENGPAPGPPTPGPDGGGELPPTITPEAGNTPFPAITVEP